MFGLSDESILNLMEKIHEEVGDEFEIIYDRQMSYYDPDEKAILKDIIDNGDKPYLKYFFLKETQTRLGQTREVYIIYIYPGVRERVRNDPTILNKIRNQIENAPYEIKQTIEALAASQAVAADSQGNKRSLYKMYTQKI